MTIYSRNAQIIGANINSDKGIFNLYDQHQLKGKNTWGQISEAFVITSLDQTTVNLSGGTYRIFLGGGGGGGSSIAGERGGLGGVFWFDVNLVAGTYYAGVGAGGKYTSTSATNPYRNGVGYACRGGNGTYGNSAGSGSGGGGSYFKGDATPTTAHWNNYYAIVGGGGGAASHGFNANNGGHGFGVGGTGYSDNYANSTVGGKNGFDGSGGAGGNPSSGTASGLYGGDADQSGQLVGGDAAYSTGHNGGGGGGGAGGGAAGAGGGSPPDAGHGGYISTNNVVGSYNTDTVARGGGGGGGHGSNCGGTGAGGGVLLFADYDNSWGTTQGTNIPHWSGSSITTSTVSQYTAWGNLSSYSSTYFGTDLTTGTLSGKSTYGESTTAGGDGFIVIASLNKTPEIITYL